MQLPKAGREGMPVFQQAQTLILISSFRMLTELLYLDKAVITAPLW